MADFLNPPSQYLSGASNEENDVRAIFYRHWEKSKDCIWQARNDIDAWRFGLIKEINLHAEEQKRLLDDDYKRWRQLFDEKRTNYLEITRAACYQNDFGQARRLLEECKALQFEMTLLCYVTRETQFVELITIEQQEQRKKQSQSEVNKTNQGSNKTATNQQTSIVSSSGPQGDSNQQPLKPGFDRSPSSGGSSKGMGEVSGDLLEKCPVCFMLFPLKMLPNDRALHINEHYKD